MKVYLVGKVKDYIIDKIESLGFEIINNNVESVTQAIQEAEIIFSFVSDNDNPIIHSKIGLAIGMKLCGKEKNIIVYSTEKHVNRAYTNEWVNLATSELHALSFLPPTSRVAKGNSADKDKQNEDGAQVENLLATIENNKKMMKALIASLYPYLVPEAGEAVTVKILNKDVEQVFKDIAVKLDIDEQNNLTIMFSSK